LFELHPTGGAPGDAIVPREIVEYVLDLEDWREPLLHHLKVVVPELRPAVRRLVDETFARPLPAFPVTFPSTWGIPAPFPHSDGLILNVWAEMVPGHYHWLNEASRRRGCRSIVGADDAEESRYCQFLGFDNSFFYVVAHLALALAARKHGIEALIPDMFVTNEFLQLENYKFSTSQGHLIWGRDLLADEDWEDVRFYLAWVNPEYNQSNFTKGDLREIASARLRRPLETFFEALSKLPPGPARPMPSLAGCALRKRFEAAYEPGSPSLRIAAQTISHGLSLATRLITSGAAPDEVRAFAQALAAGTAPIAPTIAETIWARAGGVGPVTWSVDLDAAPDSLPVPRLVTAA
jgi:methionyl-tRNA synthetase